MAIMPLREGHLLLDDHLGDRRIARRLGDRMPFQNTGKRCARVSAVATATSNGVWRLRAISP